jgi:uncharacterized Zn finger protein (UPF0148 family)
LCLLRYRPTGNPPTDDDNDDNERFQNVRAHAQCIAHTLTHKRSHKDFSNPPGRLALNRCCCFLWGRAHHTNFGKTEKVNKMATNSRAASASTDRSAGLKRSGEMMLSGWRMLADHCTICKFPLMGKGGDLRCPGCDMKVVYDEGQSNSQPPPPPAPKTSNTEIDEEDDEDFYDEDDVDFPASLEEMKKEYDLKNKKTKDVSAKLGEKMLAGWVLLGDICLNEGCRGTPLMKSKTSPDMMCVGCDEWYVFRDQRLEPRDKMPSTAASKKPAASSNGTKFSEQQAANNFQGLDVMNAPFLRPYETNETMDASEKISKKLLQGWTLLDRVCEGACKGAVPLMRNMDGGVVCVVCSDNSSGTKAAPSGLPKSNTATAAATARTKNPVRRGSNEDDDEIDMDLSDDDAVDSYKSRRLNELVQSTTSAPASSSTAAKATAKSKHLAGTEGANFQNIRGKAAEAILKVCDP